MTQTICEGFTLSCLPQTRLHSPWSPESSFSVLGDLSAGEGTSLDEGISILLHLPPGVQVLSHFFSSSFSLLSFILHIYLGDFYCLFRCSMFSTSVHSVLCENCPMCKCILDGFVR